MLAWSDGEISGLGIPRDSSSLVAYDFNETSMPFHSGDTAGRRKRVWECLTPWLGGAEGALLIFRRVETLAIANLAVKCLRKSWMYESEHPCWFG